MTGPCASSSSIARASGTGTSYSNSLRAIPTETPLIVRKPRSPLTRTRTVAESVWAM